jgi:4,5-dihydroxyphthalate decarboxylase
MTDIKLKFAMMPHDRVLPLIKGEVKPKGITLEYDEKSGGVFDILCNEIKSPCYDLFELSLLSYLRMRSIKWPYLMLPVYHNRAFSFAGIYVRLSSGIRQNHPEDLKGKRVGIHDYQQTQGLWTRGILQNEFGVKAEDMVWYQDRGQDNSYTSAFIEAGLPPLKNIELHYTADKFSTMYSRGELDADTGLDRKRASNMISADIINLFPDPKMEAVRYFKKTGICPPHHTTVVKESILKEHPWVATSLMEAFEESKRIAETRKCKETPSPMVFGETYPKEVSDVLATDLYPIGVKANAETLDTALTFSVQQGLTERKLPIEEIYPKEVLP